MSACNFPPERCIDEFCRNRKRCAYDDSVCVCGAPSVLYDANMVALCRACADACKYAPDEGEAVH